MKQFNRHRNGMMIAAHNHDFPAFHRAWRNAVEDRLISDKEFEHLFDLHSELEATAFG